MKNYDLFDQIVNTTLINIYSLSKQNKTIILENFNPKDKNHLYFEIFSISSVSIFTSTSPYFFEINFKIEYFFFLIIILLYLIAVLSDRNAKSLANLPYTLIEYENFLPFLIHTYLSDLLFFSSI